MKLEKGAVLLFEGEAHKSDCYLILEGRLDIRLVTASGHETLLYKLQAGELVGELSLFGKTTRTATVTAASPTRLLCVDSHSFAQSMGGDDFKLRLMHHFLERYIRSHEVIRRLGQPKVSHKIARHLMSLDVWTDASSDEVSIVLPGHAELAMKLSCQRETVTRAMRDLAELGVLKQDKSGKTSLNRERLQQFLDA
ncbi:MAG: Crp/Fnr family transcriptional regulator [Mariprofundaceae bacterium]|nr:Crp/Fnr family transcriptional regulator [Mariprofundaceae bacterium]